MPAPGLALVLAVWAAASGALAQGAAACGQDPALGGVVPRDTPCHPIEARLERPRPGYGHEVLGTGHEYASLFVVGRETGDLRGLGYAVEDRFGVRVTLPMPLLFEDLAPRVVELDGDPVPELLVVEANISGGARLAVYDMAFRAGREPEVRRIAATGFLGRYRWLAPLGVADFDADGRNEIAWVETPHIAPVLRLARLQAGEIVEIAALAGPTNHRKGAPVIESGVRACAGVVEAVLVDGAWENVIAARLESGALTLRDLGPYDGADSVRRALVCE